MPSAAPRIPECPFCPKSSPLPQWSGFAYCCPQCGKLLLIADGVGTGAAAIGADTAGDGTGQKGTIKGGMAGKGTGKQGKAKRVIPPSMMVEYVRRVERPTTPVQVSAVATAAVDEYDDL